MKKRVLIIFAILGILLSGIGLGNILLSQSHQVMAEKKPAYKVVEGGGSKAGNPEHVQRLLNVMAEEGWTYVNVVPMTDLFIFKK